jgi:sec-independent protein translocase protein TatA
MYMGQTEWMIVGGIALVLFGGSKIPQLAKGLGEGIREFKKSIEGMGEEEKPKANAKSAE